MAGRPAASARSSIEEGFFPKHGITSAAQHLTAPDGREGKYWGDHPQLPGRRLACGCEVLGDLMVFVPEESQARKQVVRKAATERAIVVDPAVKLYYVEIEPPTLEHQLGDWDRLAAELAERFGLDGLRLDPVLLGSLQEIVRAAGLEGDGDGLARSRGDPGAAGLSRGDLRAGGRYRHRPPSPCTCAICARARCWRPPAA